MTAADGTRWPLEPSGDDMRVMAERAMDVLVRFVEGLPSAPAVDITGGDEVARLFRGPAPERGRPLAEALNLFETAAAKAVETAGPGYMAYIPGGGLYSSALGSFLALAVNRFVGMAQFAPALVQIEASVLRWFGDLFDYPPQAAGILTTGGSLANFSAIVTARTALLPEAFLDGVLYTSAQAHHSIARAAVLAGFPARHVRQVPCTPDLRMDVEALEAMVDADRVAGHTPFCVVANAGTTNTGAVDPLDDLSAYTRRAGLWLHVDAAYGGFFQLTERGRSALSGIQGADSITLDPHKTLFLPYGTGALLVRDGSRLREAHRAEADYLQDISAEAEIPDFAGLSPELSRDLRGLRVWLPIQLHGMAGFREALDEKLDLARYVYDELRASPGFEVPWEPTLTIVAFRYGFGSGDENAANQDLLRRINSSGRVFLSSTKVDGRTYLRVCVVSHRTHRDRVEECVRIIREAVAATAEGLAGNRTPGA